jgi:N-acetylmuramoyl-L-alanine amidase
MIDLKIIHDYIPAGMRHRPMKNPASSLYNTKMVALYFVLHNAYFAKWAKELHAYCKSSRAAARPASWHNSIDHQLCYQSIPWDESAWHAGCNMCHGNTRSHGVEVCDAAMLQKDQDWDLFWQAMEHAALLAAYYIHNTPTYKPFPECMTQHWDWSGKNCPSWIRKAKGSYNKWLDLVYDFRKVFDKEEPEETEEVVEEAIPDLPDDALIAEEEPDLDRGWIDSHPEEFEDDQDPYEDKKPRRKVSVKLYGDPHAKIKVYQAKTPIINRNDWIKRSRGLWRPK